MDPIQINTLLASLVATADGETTETTASEEAHGGQQSAVTLDLDHSFFIQLGLLLVLMALLNKLVFQPFLRSVEAREAKTTHMRAEAEALRTRGEALRTQYAEGISGAREAATSARRALRGEGVDDKEGRVQAARESAAASQAATDVEVAKAYDAARTELLAQVDGLSRQVVEKVLGRGV